MGQYYKGTKIGTCENMYYLTIPEAQRLAEIGAKDDDGIAFETYLKDNQTRFRFSFPNECEQGAERQPFKTFMVSAGGAEVSHDEIVIHNSHQGGGYGMNIWIPCPHSKEFNLKTSSGGCGSQFLEVKFQAIRDGEEKTIFGCARCGKMQRFGNDDIAKIKIASLEHYKVYDKSNTKDSYEYYLKCIELIK